jgi:sortase A
MLAATIRKHARRLVFIALALGGGVLTLQGLWIPAKAQVAQLLLARAWQEAQVDGGVHKPWAWADHWPVARLRMPAHGVDQIVLAGDSGNVLAFAPGQNMQASTPGAGGTSVISGHRDTHFRFLQRVKRGEEILVETTSGRVDYRVISTRVVDVRTTQIQPRSDEDELLLVTCYPFDSSQTSGPLRYVVTAQIAENDEYSP